MFVSLLEKAKIVGKLTKKIIKKKHPLRVFFNELLVIK